MPKASTSDRTIARGEVVIAADGFSAGKTKSSFNNDSICLLLVSRPNATTARAINNRLRRQETASKMFLRELALAARMTLMLGKELATSRNKPGAVLGDLTALPRRAVWNKMIRLLAELIPGEQETTAASAILFAAKELLAFLAIPARPFKEFFHFLFWLTSVAPDPNSLIRSIFELWEGTRCVTSRLLEENARFLLRSEHPPRTAPAGNRALFTGVRSMSAVAV